MERARRFLRVLPSLLSGLALLAAAAVAAAQSFPSEDVRRRLNSQGFEPAPTSPEAFGAFLAAEVQKYANVIRDTGVKLD
jgi:tripartite-type tricarboxylate transporter receptor subunit TctC